MDAPLTPTITVRAHAKANFYLRILGRRPDGYHDLATIFQTLTLADTLEFSAELGRNTLHLRSTHPELPDGPTNLIHQAWRLLLDRFPERIPQPGVLCRIDKQIPLEAGLGGGSADAAATLVALNRLWKLELPPPELRQLGLELGSDVPFPLLGGTAFGTGRGESLTTLAPLPETHLVLCCPPVGVSTASAFGWWDAAHPTPEAPPNLHEIRQLWEQVMQSGEWPQYVHNDFEALVCAAVPEIGAVRDALRNRGLCTVMTGSGSAVIGICPDFDTAARIAQSWQPVAGERVVLTSTWPGSGAH